MHYDTDLAQALATADSLIDEWQQLREDTADTTPGRLQELAMRELERELSQTIDGVIYRRKQEQEKTERELQQKLDQENADQEQATRDRLRQLTQPAEHHCALPVGNAGNLCELTAGHAGEHRTHLQIIDDERRRRELATPAPESGIVDAPALTCGRHISLNNPSPCARPAGHDGEHASLAETRLEEDVRRLNT